MPEDLGPPGPPDDDARPKPGHAEPVATKAPRYIRQNNPPHRQRRPETRREASRRLPPLGPCGCIRDPLHDHHRCGGEITETMVDGYRDAVLHLRSLGLLPAPLVKEMQVLWRRGGADRRLVTEISSRWELAG